MDQPVEKPHAEPIVASSARHLYPVILSGGSGTRLWPLSRLSYPKQLLPLISERTMLQETALRAATLGNGEVPLVVCHHDHRFLVAEQLLEIGVRARKIVLEPDGRNTGAALAVAALMLARHDPDAAILALPSDHHIADTARLRAALEIAHAAARAGRLVAFGIAPARPETGYGYIRRGATLDGVEGAFAIGQFIEKPDRADAARYVESGDYFWNSGMFVMPVALLLEELKRLQPTLLGTCMAAVAGGRDDADFFHLEEGAFAAVPALSIDKGVMELSHRTAFVPAAIGWSDVGSWTSLHELKPQDEAGNVLEGDVAIDDVRNSYVRGDGHFVAALGVSDIVLVATEDAILVAGRGRAAEIGRFVERLKGRNRPEALHHAKVYRPWGSYQTVVVGERFQVKRIVVKPGRKLSLQMHHHRAEHWVVVQGTARITCGDECRLLHENQSTYIPLGVTHRLENPGKLPLHLIEVQSGPYLGEDDIVRFEDDYGRGAS
ncbi:MAG TPA: mannose-1-phosphate guanylyltransferase/mannose-6-phosphate isomerase [Alphaproteobacteria bacterium]|nr:mannose-1-phosphate guanylyltransferase/mannose-6-phosphate isomerase [Alphaproteobacteria bacterium]